MTDTTPETARLTADVVDRDAETGLPFDSGVDTAVERWFRTHFNAATALGFPMAGYVAERDTQRRLQDRLASRVITAETGHHDAADLARENAELRKLLADAPTSEAAIAKLREWSSHAGPDREWQPGAIQIAMPVAMARKILDEIDGLTAELAETRADRETFRATLEQDAAAAELAVDYLREKRRCPSCGKDVGVTATGAPWQHGTAAAMCPGSGDES